jgi:hypothetical protein
MTKPSRRSPTEALRDAAKGAAAPEALPFRAAPHNLEAEQALWPPAPPTSPPPVPTDATVH